MLPMATSKSTVGVFPPVSDFCALERPCDGHHSWCENRGKRKQRVTERGEGGRGSEGGEGEIVREGKER